MNRRGILSLFGLGTGAAVSGVGPGALASSAGFAPLATPFGDAIAGGRVGPNPFTEDLPPIEERARSALSWLTAHGLPEEMRARIRVEAEYQATLVSGFPPEIEALRSFSASAKRRLYVQHLVRIREREALAHNRTDLLRHLNPSRVPDAVRALLSGRW